MEIRELILAGKTALGIELGSTRIKGVLIDYEGNVLAVGSFEWENQLLDGVWTYSLEDAVTGLRSCYSSLRRDVEEKYGITPAVFGAIGISGMMHGFIALDAAGRQLAPFQTWRNTNTGQAADELTELLGFNIPLRWSAAHLYQRILDGEEYVKDIGSVYTLASYMHYRLTGRKVIGIGEASGMFPIDSETFDYDEQKVERFDALLASKGCSLHLKELFPAVLKAGDQAGYLTEEGAALLDETGSLQAGIPLCPPEGDAGTGMTATNSVGPGTGNLSAGTSTFAMVVLEKQMSRVYREIDMVTTPSGFPVAMSHANNGTTDLNAWIGLFREFCGLMGIQVSTSELFEKLYTYSLQGDPDCGGLLSYGYYSGENITFMNEGRPLYVRTPKSRFNLANFMKANLYTSLGAVALGMNILFEEGVRLDRMMGHGGLFKTKGVVQRYLSAAVHAPVTVMETASEGGAWGAALLAAYMADGKYPSRAGGGQAEAVSAEGIPAEAVRAEAVRAEAVHAEAGHTGDVPACWSLEDYLERRVFAGLTGQAIMADQAEIEGFARFLARYEKGLDIEKLAIDVVNW